MSEPLMQSAINDLINHTASDVLKRIDRSVDLVCCDMHTVQFLAGLGSTLVCNLALMLKDVCLDESEDKLLPLFNQKDELAQFVACLSLFSAGGLMVHSHDVHAAVEKVNSPQMQSDIAAIGGELRAVVNEICRQGREREEEAASP